MGTLVKPFTASNGVVIDATEYNANLDTLYTGVNGNIDSANIAAGGVDTAELADDAVDDTKIDWGTGAHQVSLDDVPNGSTSKLGQDCSSTGSPTFASPTVTTLNLGTTGKLTSGGIDFCGANTGGWISNLGITYSSGVFTITDAQGATLSSTNPGWVTLPASTGGQLVQLKVTTPFSFNDDAHASSDLTNLGFGITESADWAEDVPFFIYFASRSDTDADGTDGNSTIFISRNPCLTSTPSSSNDIGDTGAIPSNDSQNVILILDDVTISNYTSLRCALIGAFRMRWSTTTDDWTVQSLGINDGIGATAIRGTFLATYTYPTGQNGASSGTHLTANGGTAPIFTTNNYVYKLHPNGEVTVYISLDGDGGTDGSGSVTSQLTLPYANSGFSQNISSFYVTTPSQSYPANAFLTLNAVYTEINIYTAVGPGGVFSSLQNGTLSAGSRRIAGQITYRAF